MNENKEFELISKYTRANAIDDGVLVDVTEMAREKGFKCPVAINSSVQAILESGLKKKKEDYKGRLSDLLFLAYMAARKAGGNSEIFFSVGIGRKIENFKMMAGPGDNAELVITITLPDED